MSSNSFSSILNSAFDIIIKKCLIKLLLTIFECLITFLFVHIPIGFYYLITLGKKDDVSVKQKQIRAKLIDENDPSSPYRAVEVLDKLQIKPEKKVETLAVIPDLCLERYADKQTMGVRQILNVEEEKQKNGKTYKKVLLLLFYNFYINSDFFFPLI